MADYALMAAQEEQKRRSGRSFFPAAQRTTLGNTPSRMLTNYSSFQNNVQIPTGGYQALSPDQNPAYQAAIAGGRPLRTGFTTISTPSKGAMSVPSGQVDKYASLLAKASGGNIAPANPVSGATPTTNYAANFSGNLYQGTFPAASKVNVGGGLNTGVQPNSALAAVQSFQQTGKFNFQPPAQPQPLPKPRSYGEMGVY